MTPLVSDDSRDRDGAVDDNVDRCRVCFRVDHDEDADVFVESLEATHLKGSLYRLDGTPFFAYGVSRGDTVRAGEDDDGSLIVTEINRKAGNRTLRVICDEDRPVDSPEAVKLMEDLISLGCDCPKVPPLLIAVNVPAKTDFEEVLALVRASSFRWEPADPTYGQLFA